MVTEVQVRQQREQYANGVRAYFEAIWAATEGGNTTERVANFNRLVAALQPSNATYNSELAGLIRGGNDETTFNQLSGMKGDFASIPSRFPEEVRLGIRNGLLERITHFESRGSTASLPIGQLDDRDVTEILASVDRQYSVARQVSYVSPLDRNTPQQIIGYANAQAAFYQAVWAAAAGDDDISKTRNFNALLTQLATSRPSSRVNGMLGVDDALVPAEFARLRSLRNTAIEAGSNLDDRVRRAITDTEDDTSTRETFEAGLLDRIRTVRSRGTEDVPPVLGVLDASDIAEAIKLGRAAAGLPPDATTTAAPAAAPATTTAAPAAAPATTTAAPAEGGEGEPRPPRARVTPVTGVTPGGTFTVGSGQSVTMIARASRELLQATGLEGDQAMFAVAAAIASESELPNIDRIADRATLRIPSVERMAEYMRTMRAAGGILHGDNATIDYATEMAGKSGRTIVAQPTAAPAPAETRTEPDPAVVGRERLAAQEQRIQELGRRREEALTNQRGRLVFQDNDPRGNDLEGRLRRIGTSHTDNTGEQVRDDINVIRRRLDEIGDDPQEIAGHIDRGGDGWDDARRIYMVALAALNPGVDINNIPAGAQLVMPTQEQCLHLTNNLVRDGNSPFSRESAGGSDFRPQEVQLWTSPEKRREVRDMLGRLAVPDSAVPLSAPSAPPAQPAAAQGDATIDPSLRSEYERLTQMAGEPNGLQLIRQQLAMSGAPPSSLEIIATMIGNSRSGSERIVEGFNAAALRIDNNLTQQEMTEIQKIADVVRQAGVDINLGSDNRVDSATEIQSVLVAFIDNLPRITGRS